MGGGGGGVASMKDVHTLSVIFDPRTSPHQSTFGWPPLSLSAEANFEYDSQFFIKYPNPNIHLHHLFPYTSTKKVIQKVKYLLTTLI